MSSKALKAAATGQIAESEKPKTIAGLLIDPTIKQQIALALPKHVTADRLARVALTEVRKNPTLAKCDQASFLGAIMQCAQLGLEPGGALGHAYLIPFENKRKNIHEVQFIMGYRGMIDLARRSGQIISLTARAVHERDHFQYRYGLDETIEHIPFAGNDRGVLMYVYAVAKLKDGGVQFEVMSRAEIENVRNESQGYKTAKRYDRTDTPWIAHFEEMAKKTAIRRLFKYLPVSIEMQRAVGLDEQAESGLVQDNPLTFDAETGEIEGERTTQAEVVSDEKSGQVVDATLNYDDVAKGINSAKSLDVLDVAADLISLVPSSADQESLTEIYHQRRAELSGE